MEWATAARKRRRQGSERISRHMTITLGRQGMPGDGHALKACGGIRASGSGRREERLYRSESPSDEQALHRRDARLLWPSGRWSRSRPPAHHTARPASLPAAGACQTSQTDRSGIMAAGSTIHARRHRYGSASLAHLHENAPARPETAEWTPAPCGVRHGFPMASRAFVKAPGHRPHPAPAPGLPAWHARRKHHRVQGCLHRARH